MVEKGHSHGDNAKYYSLRAEAIQELLIEKDELGKIFILRKILAPMGTTESMEFLLEKMKNTKTNNDFFQSMGTK